MIGKPYSGKPNVRFDEGELEIELLATTPALYSTELLIPLSEDNFLKSSIHIVIPDYKWQSSRDNFYNTILNIDKVTIFSIFDSIILIDFLFPKGGGMEKDL